MRYVVYEFFKGEEPDIEDSQTIIALTPYHKVLVSEGDDRDEMKGMTFMVTALDRMNRESLPMQYKVK